MKANMDYEELRNSMTVQDAARVLKETNCYGTMDIAKNVILKALETQPSEDCISRKAAIDALWKALHEYEDKTENQFLESKELDVADWFQHRIFVQNMSDIDRQTILNLPSVNPHLEERTETHECDCISRKGHWIKHKHNGKPYFKCSECLYFAPIGYSYCPSCGAKMQEEEQ